MRTGPSGDTPSASPGSPAAAAEELWQSLTGRTLQIQDALQRLKVCLTVQPRHLDVALEHVLKLRNEQVSFRETLDIVVANDRKVLEDERSSLEVVMLRAKLSGLHQEKQELQQSLHSLEIEAPKLAEEHRLQKIRNGRIQVQMMELRQEVQDLAARREAVVVQHHSELQAAQQMEERLKQQGADVRRLGDRTAELEEELATEKERSADLEASLDAMRTMREEAEDEASKLREELTALQSVQQRGEHEHDDAADGDRIVDLEEALDAMRTLREEAEDEASKLREELRSVQQRGWHEHDPGAERHDPGANDDRLMDLEEALDAMRTLREEAEDEASKLREDLMALQSVQQQGGRERDTSADHDRLVDLEEALGAMRTLRQEAEDEAVQLREELASLRQLEEQRGEQPGSARDATRSQRPQEGQGGELEARADRLQAALEAERDRVADLEETLLGVREMRENAEDELSQLLERERCKSCQDVPRGVALQPCLHVALCYNCARGLQECPACGAVIERCDKLVFA